MDDRHRWEQELRDRQRNIVFPDTVRNEGQFYRNIAYGTAPLNLVQRIGVVILAVPALVFGLTTIASGFYLAFDLKASDGGTVVSLLFGVLGCTLSAVIGIVAVWFSVTLLRAAARRPAEQELPE